MPNRIIKESAFTSDRIAALSDFEFRLWVGLITQADDAGRGDARPAILKGRVFALRERTTVSDIEKALHALAAHGCVSLYTVGGKPYYVFPSWAAHQRVRDAKPKYPGPEEADENDNSPQLAATRGETPPKSNPIQSNPNHNPIQSERARAQNIPALDAVIAYCRERKSKVNPKRFFEYNNAHGWKGITDWQAALRSWEANGIDGDPNEAPPSYDIVRAEERAKTKVPELKKRRNAG